MRESSREKEEKKLEGKLGFWWKKFTKVCKHDL